MASVDQAEGTAISVQLQATGSGVPADNVLSAVATYAAVSGEPRTASLQAGLSLNIWLEILKEDGRHIDIHAP